MHLVFTLWAKYNIFFFGKLFAACVMYLVASTMNICRGAVTDLHIVVMQLFSRYTSTLHP